MRDSRFLNNNNSPKLTVIALLSSLAAVLSIFESFLPIGSMLPPGVKFGFSNIVVMFAAESMGLFPALLVSFLKSAFVFCLKGPMAFLMSFFGGMLSAVSVWLLLKIKKPLSFIFISIVGSVIHSLTQVCIASFIVSNLLFYYLPILLVCSVISGTLTGISLKFLMPTLKRSLRL